MSKRKVIKATAPSGDPVYAVMLTQTELDILFAIVTRYVGWRLVAADGHQLTNALRPMHWEDVPLRLSSQGVIVVADDYQSKIHTQLETEQDRVFGDD